MNTPIVDFVKSYAESGTARLHMPGHKGKGLLGVERYDITEIDGADVLYSPKGIILESENNATELFKTAHTYYSTEGSSLGIKAMLAIATNGKEPLILAARNVHKAFLYGAALLDLKVSWLYPEEASHICACVITPQNLQSKLESMATKPSAVYVTSPDYLGNVQDIKGLSEVCHRFGLPLLVDNAHGAYLGFLNESRHPIHLGADMCCDSAHKTLPVLTGGAYLHISKNAPKSYCENARRFLSVFASTSPSYLIMQSLDMCNKVLDEGFEADLLNTVEKIDRLKADLQSVGWIFKSDEPLKLTLDCRCFGACGEQVAEILHKSNIECEFYDRDVVVLMFTPYVDDEFYEILKTVLSSVEKGVNEPCVGLPLCEGEQAMSIREALFSEQETVSVEMAVGRVCAAPNVACPPAVPPVMSGEVITEDTLKILKYYNIEKIDVVK
ncbi:MAG: PLP-dependent transferase [Clostridia bacterium]|nr:PLP-dependent transferase [Clostridia bacterium]